MGKKNLMGPTPIPLLDKEMSEMNSCREKELHFHRDEFPNSFSNTKWLALDTNTCRQYAACCNYMFICLYGCGNKNG